MNFDKVRAVLASYNTLLTELGHPSTRWVVGGTPQSLGQLAHARWMCVEAATNPEFTEGKAKRWLGFVQGVLWSTGVRTIEQMKDDNRPQVRP